MVRPRLWNVLAEYVLLVDNQYLTSVLETGFVGAIALVVLFLTGWLTARSARLAAVDAQTRDLGQSLAASVAAAALCFATFDALSFSIASGLCFLILGSSGRPGDWPVPTVPEPLNLEPSRKPRASRAAGFRRPAPAGAEGADG